jgi:putative flippase GtrA
MGAGDLIREMTERPFARFVVAGACGFATDAAVLSLLVSGLGIDPHLARLGSFACALIVTWTINRFWTFAHAPPLKRRFPIYVGVQIAGAVLNLAAYSATLLLIPALRDFPIVALVPAALAGLSVTFLGSKYIAFGEH